MRDRRAARHKLLPLSSLLSTPSRVPRPHFRARSMADITSSALASGAGALPVPAVGGDEPVLGPRDAAPSIAPSTPPKESTVLGDNARDTVSPGRKTVSVRGWGLRATPSPPARALRGRFIVVSPPLAPRSLLPPSPTDARLRGAPRE
jgi:hypothetical protein